MFPVPSFPVGKIQREHQQYDEKKILANHDLPPFLFLEIIFNYLSERRSDGRDC
jgi:hypothetical protein